MQAELQELELRENGQLAKLLGDPLSEKPPEALERLTFADQRQAEVKPGGQIIFSVRSDEDAGFVEKQRALEDEGRWQLSEVTGPYRQLPLADPELKARCFAYRVC